MEALAGKKILIIQQRSWAKRIGRMLARNLAAEGACLSALTLKPKTHAFVIKQQEVLYEHIYSLDEVREDPEKYLAGDRYSLSEVCGALGIDSIWPHVVALRNHARCFGEKHFYSFRQNVSDEQIVLYIQAIYKLIRKIFDECDPDLIITPNFVSLPHIMLSLYADKNGRRVLSIVDGKVRGMSLFVNSFNADRGRFFDRLGELSAGAISENAQKARVYIAGFREQYKMPTHLEAYLDAQEKGLWKKIIFEVRPYYLALGWYAKALIPQMRVFRDIDRVKILGPTIDWRPPRYMLREHYAIKRYAKAARTFPYHPFEKIEKFAYFPLQYQPESNIDVCAPFFSNQIEAARLTAMSLPGEYTLVVKDHPGMVGYRTPSYLEKLARTPNVKLIDHRISTAEIIKRAGIVISPGGTAPVEAALYSRPAIQFGNLGTTLVLPNTRKHTDMTTLGRAIREMLVKDLSATKYEQSLENYVAATYDAGFDFNYLASWQYGRKVDMAPLWEAYKKEILYALSSC